MLGFLLLNYHYETILTNESPEMIKFSYFPGMNIYISW